MHQLLICRQQPFPGNMMQPMQGPPQFAPPGFLGMPLPFMRPPPGVLPPPGFQMPGMPPQAATGTELPHSTDHELSSSACLSRAQDQCADSPRRCHCTGGELGLSLAMHLLCAFKLMKYHVGKRRAAASGLLFCLPPHKGYVPSRDFWVGEGIAS